MTERRITSEASVTTQDFGFATVTFTNQIVTHDVTLKFTVEVDPATVDASELAWEAAAEWPEAGWGSDNPVWGIIGITVTVNGVTTEVE